MYAPANDNGVADPRPAYVPVVLRIWAPFQGPLPVVRVQQVRR